MALYHLTLKNDKKQSGARVKAVEHVSYIDREGKYEDWDQKKDVFFDNWITSAEKPDALHGEIVELYSSPFGVITNTKKGLAVSSNPSYDTLAIAMTIAEETMHAPLVIEGSEKFKARCVIAALETGLPITFADEQMQTYFEQKKEERNLEEKRFQSSGGRIVAGRSSAEKPDPAGHRRKISKAPSLGTVSHLRRVPERVLAAPEPDAAAVLVSADESRLLVNGREESDDSLRRHLQQRGRGRREFRRERRLRAERDARRILKGIEQSMDNVYAEAHVEYIDRERAFAKKGGCVYKGNRLPEWAEGSPNKFFKAADRYSPKSSRRYKEFEFALQNELTLEQNLEIVQAFIDKVLPNHYYSFAVHDKIGAMSDGTHNLHVHLMFSPRIIDDVEEKQERAPKDYFKYPLRETAKDQSFEARRARGAPMERYFRQKEFLMNARRSYAEITNETLRKYGKSARIDHHSLKYQKEKALAEGDTLLAKILDRLPEQHIANGGILDTESPAAAALRRERQLKNKTFNLLFEEEQLKEELKDMERQEKTESLLAEAEDFVTSEAFLTSDASEDSYLGELRKSFLDAFKELQIQKTLLLTWEQAYENAELEYLTDEEKEDFQDYQEKHQDRIDFEAFLEKIKEEVQKEKEEDGGGGGTATQKAVAGLEGKLLEKQQAEESAGKKLETVKKKLQNEDRQKQIKKNAHQALKENRSQKFAYEKSQRQLAMAMDTLKQALYTEDAEEVNRDQYTIRELEGIMRKRYYGLRKEQYKLKGEYFSLKKKILSPARARKIAEDRFFHGGLKKWREDRRAWEKEKKKFEAQDPPDAALLRKNQKWGKELEVRKEEFEMWLVAPGAEEAIQQITLKVLEDNRPYRDRLAVKEQQLNRIEGKVEATRVEMVKLQAMLKKSGGGGGHRLYRVAPHPSGGTVRYQGSEDKPGIIASALFGDEKMAQLVLTAKDEDEARKGNWAFLSEAAKEEQAEKGILHDI